MKESKFVKTKIVAGYVILIAVCVLAVGYVYRAVVRFSTSDGSYSLLHTKRNVVGQTLYHLYQAESYGPADDRRLQVLRGAVQTRIAHRARLYRLVARPDRGAGFAADDASGQHHAAAGRQGAADDEPAADDPFGGSTASLLDKNIRDLIGPADSVDSVGFCATACRCVRWCRIRCPWRVPRRAFSSGRFADLFSPPKEDSSIVISHRERVVDSLPARAVKDTIAIVLRTLQDQVTSDRIGIYDRAWDEGMRLRYSNELVNTKIYRLIMDFEAEDTAFLLGKIDQTEAIRRRSSYVLGGIAIVAVVLMLLFVGILLRDINRSTRYRRALEQANRDNEALLAAREKLMLAITHDIKAPLGSVMGYIDLLSRLTDGQAAGTLPAQYEGVVGTPAGAGQQPVGLLPARTSTRSTWTTWRSARHNCSRRSARGLRRMAAAKGIALCSETGPGAAGRGDGRSFPDPPGCR